MLFTNFSAGILMMVLGMGYGWLGLGVVSVVDESVGCVEVDY